MRSSVVNHPENEPLIIIRQWQLVFCDGNEVAAALLSFFEYWHNIKLDMATQNRTANEVAQQHGDTPSADTSLYQWHTEAELIAGIQRIAKSGKTLTKAIDILISKGVITIHKNPNPSYKFDKKRYFLFYPEVVNAWLMKDYRPSKNTSSSSKNTSSSSKKALSSGKIPSAITEITPETTTESLKASSATADYSRPISLLSEKEVRSLELTMADWKQYLADEQAERNRKGITKFIEGKIKYGLLRPVNEEELQLFEILAIEYDADGGKTPPSKFPSLETKRLFNEAAQFHNGTLESVIRKAIHKRGKGIAKIIDYLSSPKWQQGELKNGQSSVRASQSKTYGQASGGSSGPADIPLGSGQTPEMRARLEAHFGGG